MTDSQNQIHVKQFKDDIIQAVQQNNSRLDGTVRRKEAVKAEEFFFHKLGSFNLLEKTSRNGTTPFIDPVHTRRKMTTAAFHGALFIDDFDTDRSIISGLDSDYMQGLIKAAKRKKDDVIIAAATGTAYEGKDGTTASALPSSQKIVHGSAGLSSTKLLNAMEIIKGNDVDPEEMVYCAITASQENDLMQDEKIINADYTAGAVLDKGIIGKWNNINFIRSERLGLDGDSNRQVLLYTENALGFGMAKDITMKVGENAERSFTKTLYLKLDVGATRIEDEKIVEIACTE
jgi:hypothetical protein